MSLRAVFAISHSDPYRDSHGNPHSNSRIVPLRASLAPHHACSESDSDAVRVAEVQHGNVLVFGAIFDQYFEALRTFALSYVHTREVAEDVVQDVFARIWEIRTEWTVQTSIAQYLFGAVRNRAIKALRYDAVAARRASLLDANGGQHSVSGVGTTELEAAELRRHLARAIDALPPRAREIFLLSRGRRLRLREIADLLGIALPTVKVQLGRALRALDRARRDYEHGGPSDGR
jgi:RNA polymerase sigma-70 factor (ECF subfamily)